MNQHSENLKQVYAHLTEGHWSKALDFCAENVSFQVYGQSPIAGKYTRSNFAEWFQKLQDLTNGTYQLQIHDILVSDLHGTALGTEKFTMNGKAYEFRVAHVWRFENGKPLAGYLYERDLYAFDAAIQS